MFNFPIRINLRRSLSSVLFIVFLHFIGAKIIFEFRQFKVDYFAEEGYGN